MTKRVVCYINQFFAGMGGEDTAHVPPEVRQEVVGPAMQIDSLFGEEAQVVGTVICGDSYYGENIEEARSASLEMIKDLEPDLVIAGPAFNAGRYGFACGDICSSVTEELGIPAVTGMYNENPGVDLYGKRTYIVSVADSARGMRKALPKMVQLACKILNKEKLEPARLEGYLHRGIRKNFFHEETGAQRGVEMALAKVRGEAFRTEYEMPVFKKITPAPPVKDISKATIALCTSGGIVPKGNPEKIRVSSAMKWAKEDISGLEDLTPDNFESIHGGYDRTWALEDPDRVLPLDMLKQLEKEGAIGKIFEYACYTTGTATSVANSEKFGQEIGELLKKEGVDAAILTST